MKKARKNNNKKSIMTLLMGLIIGLSLSGIGTYAATTYAINANKIEYTDNASLGVDNVQAAIDGTCTKFSGQLTSLKESIINTVYPVGSIYMSTSDDTVEKVQSKFGGTWAKYSKGTTLVGDDGTNYVTNDSRKGSGGSSTVTLSTSNLPSHSHSFTPSGSVTSTFSGSSVSTSSADTSHTHYFSATTSTNGNHKHTQTVASSPYGTSGLGIAGNSGYIYDAFSNQSTGAAGDHNHTVSGNTGGMSQNSTHSHTVTAKGSVSSTFAGAASTTGSTGSGSAINIQNPYTVVYMYKRTA